MDREEVKRVLLEYGWEPEEREHLAELFRTLETDPRCRQAAADFDRLRAALAVPKQECEPSDGWEAYEDRLLAAVRDRRPRVWWRSSTIAAAALLVIVVAWQAVRIRTQTDSAPTGQSSLARVEFLPREIANGVSLYRELASFFDRRASWVSVTDAAPDLGLSADPTTKVAHLLLLRLVVNHDGSVVSSTDLVIVPGQTATLTVPLQGSKPQLHYKIATAVNGTTRLSLWAELREPNGPGQTLAALATHLPVANGQVCHAGEMATTAGRYEVKVAFAQAKLDENES